MRQQGAIEKKKREDSSNLCGEVSGKIWRGKLLTR